MLLEIRKKFEASLKGSYASEGEIAFVQSILAELQPSDFSYYERRKYSVDQFVKFFCSIPDALTLSEARENRWGEQVEEHRSLVIESVENLLAALERIETQLVYRNGSWRGPKMARSNPDLAQTVRLFSTFGKQRPLDRILVRLLRLFLLCLKEGGSSSVMVQTGRGRKKSDHTYFYEVVDTLAKQHIPRGSTALLEKVLSADIVRKRFGTIEVSSIRRSICRSRRGEG